MHLGLLRCFTSFIFLICTKAALAQMAFPSNFPDVTSTNPAVIALKNVGVARFKYKNRTIKRKQNIASINGNNIEASQEDSLNIWKYNLMGGSSKPQYGTEWMLDYTQGSQATGLESENQKINYNLKTWAYLIRYAFSTKDGFGAELRYSRHRSSFSYESKDTSEAIGDNVNWNSALPGLKIGTRFGNTKYAYGFTLGLDELSSRVDTRFLEKEKSIFITTFGISAGTRNTFGHFEIGFDVDPFSDRKKGPLEESSPPIPSKLTVVAEKKFWRFILGYIGILYNGRFIEPENIVLTQLVHRNNLNGTRIQHIFKFAYGSFPKGFSLGGSIYLTYSNTKEKSSVYLGKEEHDTETLGKGFGLSLSYTF